MYAYLKFGLPRVFPPNGGPNAPKGFKDTSSDIQLDSVSARNHGGVMRARSETDLVNGGVPGHSGGHNNGGHPMGLISNRFRRPNKANSESNLVNGNNEHLARPMSKAGSQVSSYSSKSWL
jgi:hypothetical protein